MDNYIVINGEKAELTQEQLEKLGIEVKKKDPFERVEKGESYWFITSWDGIEQVLDGYELVTDKRYENANYCTDKALMKQRALHETLDRLLWRYSMQHDGEKIFYKDYTQHKYSIYSSCKDGRWDFGTWYNNFGVGTAGFDTRTTAEAAIEEIVKPFMEQHPEFRW